MPSRTGYTVVAMVATLLLVACGAIPTPTPLPEPTLPPQAAPTSTLVVAASTATHVPPSATPPPPTAAPVPPTATLAAATAVPPTPVPPTAMPVPSVDMVRVPAGEFLMGSADSDTQAKSDEKPQHRVHLEEFWIDKTEVTNAAFTRFVQATGYKTTGERPNHPGGIVLVISTAGFSWTPVKGADWQHPSGPSSSIDARPNHPVVQVNWDDAVAYCAWAGKRLPTEPEWEKAARGADGRIYPWGDAWDASQANTLENPKNDVVAVGSYASGASIYGALDMAGNAWEWVADWHSASYYASAPARNPQGPSSGAYRVLRGGGWDTLGDYARTSKRSPYLPAIVTNYVGFRCARGSVS